MTNLYDNFLTSEIICLEELPNITDIFLKKKQKRDKSILKERKHEIDDFFDKKAKEYKVDKKLLFNNRYYIFNDIINLYNKLDSSNIKLFCIKLIFFLYSVKENISSIEKYLDISVKISTNKNIYPYENI